MLNQAFAGCLADYYGAELVDALIVPRQLQLVPEIELWLLQDDYPKQCLSRSTYENLMAAPPYWAFCWGGGQAMARYLLDHPAWVKGRCVVDFGAGSGVAGIAAAMVGASRVQAVDIDPLSCRAAAANGELNGVNLSVGQSFVAGDCEIMLAADVCYEEEGMVCVKKHLANQGRIIVADSRIEQLAEKLPGVKQVAEYEVKTFPDLEENDCFAKVRLYTN